MIRPATCLICLALQTLLFATAVAAPPGWKLIWSDEFDGPAVDDTKWRKVDWTTPHNKERQAYHPSRATVVDGNLVLTADDEEYGGKQYTSGKVVSRFARQHGRWEIRAQLPGTRGTWPAIWLLPNTDKYPWPSEGEIDIMEARGDKPWMTSIAFHWGVDHRNRKLLFEEQAAKTAGRQANYQQEMHTYAVEWTAEKIEFFVDDVNHGTFFAVDTDGFLRRQSAPMYVQINVAVGGIFVKAAQPDETSVWPQQMLVDYVRIYERDGAPAMVFTNGDFEAAGGTLAEWSLFGDVVADDGESNVSAQASPARNGTAAVKLLGQSPGELNECGITQGISVRPGERLSATAWVQVPEGAELSGGDTGIMKIEYYTKRGARPGGDDFLSAEEKTVANTATPSGTWQQHTLESVAPNDAAEARIVLIYSQQANGGGAVVFDDVSFQTQSIDGATGE